MTIKNFSGYKITVFFRNNRTILPANRVLPFSVVTRQRGLGPDAEAVPDTEHDVAEEGVGVQVEHTGRHLVAAVAVYLNLAVAVELDAGELRCERCR